MKPIAIYITFIVLFFAYGATYQQPDPALYNMHITETRDSEVFAEEELSLATNDCKLYGTLLMPSQSEKQFPLVLIIAGSGPTDRNCNSPLLPGQNNTYKMLAEELAVNQIASFRYDKRGIGASKLSPERLAEVSFQDYVNDATEWIELLREDKRFSKIIVAGHSEGSLIGIIAARAAKADALISLTGMGRPMDQVIIEQVTVQLQGLPLLDTVMYYFDILREGRRIRNVNPILISLFNPGSQLFLIEIMQHDPAKEIARLDIPILIIHAANDIQIKEKDALLLYQAKPSAKLVTIKDMNHVLKNAEPADLSAYGNPELPVAPELIKELVGFIKFCFISGLSKR